VEDFNIYGKIRFVGKVEIENMITDTQQRKGLIQSNHSVFSPILIREGLRPSIVAQHLEQVIKEKERERRLQELIRL
jgi:hypothetical protein